MKEVFLFKISLKYFDKNFFIDKLLKHIKNYNLIKSLSKIMSQIALEDPKKAYQFKILNKELITHDTLRLTFELPSKNHLLGAKSGQHVFFLANIDYKEISRKYTPISLENEKGTFQFVIKVRNYTNYFLKPKLLRTVQLYWLFVNRPFKSR